MTPYRSRLLGLLLFGLLSLGQAHPFSTAWGMSQKNHPCCCKTERPRPCDCDHRHSLKKKKFSCHEAKDDGSPKFAAAPCGQKTQTVSLNFRGETCLPQFTVLSIPQKETRGFDVPPIVLPQVLAVPESPPPRLHTLS